MPNPDTSVAATQASHPTGNGRWKPWLLRVSGLITTLIFTLLLVAGLEFLARTIPALTNSQALSRSNLQQMETNFSKRTPPRDIPKMEPVKITNVTAFLNSRHISKPLHESSNHVALAGRNGKERASPALLILKQVVTPAKPGQLSLTPKTATPKSTLSRSVLLKSAQPFRSATSKIQFLARRLYRLNLLGSHPLRTSYSWILVLLLAFYIQPTRRKYTLSRLT